MNLFIQFPFHLAGLDHCAGLLTRQNASASLAAFAADLRQICLDFFCAHSFKKGMCGASAIRCLFSGNFRHLNNSPRRSVLPFGQSSKGRRLGASSIFSRTIKAVSVPFSRIGSRDATDETLYFTAYPADVSEGEAVELSVKLADEHINNVRVKIELHSNDVWRENLNNNSTAERNRFAARRILLWCVASRLAFNCLTNFKFRFHAPNKS